MNRPDLLRPEPLLPHPRRLSPDAEGFAEVMAAHDGAVATGADTYRDPRTGYDVFTAPAHLRRGACCSSSCRHCPFVF